MAYVETLRQAKEFRDVHGDSSAIADIISYCEAHITAFEQGESEAKADAWLRCRRESRG